MRDGHGMLLEPQKKLGSLRTSLTDLHGRLGLLKEKLTCLKQNSVIGTLEGWALRCFALPEFTESIHPNQTAYSFASKITEITQEVFEGALNAVIAINENKIPTTLTGNTIIQKSALTDGDTVILCGDIHGSIHALMRILRSLRQAGYISDDFELAPRTKLIFLGDYEDRGRYGVEVIFTLMYMKIKNKDRLFLLRGNHDGDDNNSSTFGFKYELAKKMHIDTVGIEKINQKIMTALPILALCLVKDDTKDRVICCHGCVPSVHDTSFKEALANTSDFIGLGSDEVQMKIQKDIQSTYFYTVPPTELIAALHFYGIKAQFNGHAHGERALTVLDTSVQKNAKGLQPRKPYVGEATFQRISTYSTIPVYTLSNCPEFTKGEGYAIISVNGVYENWQMKIVDLTEKNDANYEKLTGFLGSAVTIGIGEKYHWGEPQVYLPLGAIIGNDSFKNFIKGNPIQGLVLLTDFINAIIAEKETLMTYGVFTMANMHYPAFFELIDKNLTMPIMPNIMVKVREARGGLNEFGAKWLSEGGVDQEKIARRKTTIDKFKDGVGALFQKILGE